MKQASLDQRLLRDTRPLAETTDFWLRWMNDRRFPWVVVVPRVVDIHEWYQLEAEHSQALLKCVNQCAQQLQAITGADKINIGALGNQVPQLHVHVIARFTDDPCWPGSVWGQGVSLPWGSDESPPWLASLKQGLTLS